MTDLDTLIHRALEDDARRAPELTTEWLGRDVALAQRHSARRSRRRVLVVGAWLSAAAATIGLLAVVARPVTDSTGPAAQPTPWHPPGEEFPIQDLGPVDDLTGTLAADGAVVRDLTRTIGVDGHPELVVFTTIQYSGGESAETWRCLSQLSSAGCSPEWNDALYVVGITSSVDNRFASYDLWTWENVPAGAAYVTYVDGDRSLWQNPIAGVAAFPDVPGRDEVAIAFDEHGNELLRVTSELVDEDSTRLSGTTERFLADIDRVDDISLVDLTNTTVKDCLTEAGGVIERGVTVFPDGIDELGAWNSCVVVVKAAVAARLAEIAPRLYNPSAGERPEVADPARQFSD